MNKFRIWDDETKSYRTSIFGCPLVSTPDGKLMILQDKNLVEADNVYPSRFKVEHCTGLADKNDKEIYEGDIVGCFCNTQVFEVKWCNERCGYFLDDIILCGSSAPATECLGNLDDTIEIIGNMHENPELLEGEI